MFKKYFLYFLLSISFASYGNDIGLKSIKLVDENKQRPLNVYVLYPTTPSNSEKNLFADNLAFVGFRAITDAKPTKEEHPLMIISHGYGGNWRNLSWIAKDMAKEGYIVALVEHPGTTTFNKDPLQASQLWQRPLDLSRVITYLEQNENIAGKINKNKITLLGHSLGGWTVMAASGTLFSIPQFIKDCEITKAPHVCSFSNEFGLITSNQNQFNTVYDSRIKSVVSLDLGFSRGFTQKSLNNFQIPVLIMAANIDIGDLPAELESGYLAKHLPKNKTTYKIVDGATHFSFMQECKPNAIKLLSEENKGDEIVCKDGNQTKRKKLHELILKQIKIFLDAN